MQHVETLHGYIKVAIVLVIIIGLAWWLWPQSKTDAQKLTECKASAGELYDTNRSAIATRNPDKSTHAYYYEQSAKSYAADLQSCEEMYGRAE